MDWLKGLDRTKLQSLLDQPGLLENVARIYNATQLENELKSYQNPLNQSGKEKLEAVPHLKIDPAKFKADSEEADVIFSKLLKSVCEHLQSCKNISRSAGFQRELASHLPLVQQHASKNNAKAYCLLGICYRWGIGVPINLAKSGQYCERAADMEFPQGYLQYAYHLMDIERNQKQAMRYFKKGADYREPTCMIATATNCQQKGDQGKAYTYYTLAAEAGHATGYNNLGIMYYNGNYLQKNLRKAVELFEKAVSLGYEDARQEAQQARMQAEEEEKHQKEVEKTVQTTELQAALHVCKFLQVKETLQPQMFSYTSPIPNIPRESGSGSLYSMKEVTLFNLIECNRVQAKHMLVEDPQGRIEKICIYNWDRLSKQKNELMRLPGTKFVLKYYNKKIPNDGLPFYRIDNPDTVDIFPPEKGHKHYLTLERVRESAKLLFGNNSFGDCLFMYNYMLENNYKDKPTVYSNIALCHVKLQQYEQAKLSALECLKVDPKHGKAQYVVALTLFRTGRIYEALEAIEKVAKNPDSSELKRLILEKIELDRKSSDFSIRTYKKKRPSRPRELSFQTNNSRMRSIELAFGEIKEFFEAIAPTLRKVMIFDGNYMEEVRMLVDQMVKWRFANHNPSVLKKVVVLAYESIRTTINKVEHSGLAYINTAKYELLGVEPRTLVGNFFGEYAMQIADRLAFLENQVETDAARLDEAGQLLELLQLYECFGEYNCVFALRRAQLLRELKRYEESEKLSKSMVVKLESTGDPKATEFKLNSAKCLRLLRQFEQSSQICRSLFEDSKFGGVAYNIAAQNEQSLKNLDKALELAHKSVEKDPTSEHVIYLCKLLAQQNGLEAEQEALARLDAELPKLLKQPNQKLTTKVCLSLQIRLCSKLGDLKRLIVLCQLVYDQQTKNIGFIETVLWEALNSNPHKQEQILERISRSPKLQVLGTILKQRWELLKQFEREASEEKIVRQCCEEELPSKIDPKQIHEEYVEIKRQTIGRSVANEEELQDSLDAEFEGYKHSFLHNGKLHVILFGNKIGLDPKEEQLFLLAVCKGFCARFYGSNGIKKVRDFYEVKINSGQRLIGRGEESNGRYVIIFDRKVTHDSVARIL